MESERSLAGGMDLKAARLAAKKRAQNAPVGPEWPNKDDITIEDALTTLTIASLALGAKIGVGCMPDGMALWVRVTIPPDAEDDRADCVSFSASSDVDGALRKAALCLGSFDLRGVWKPNKFSNNTR